MYSIFADADNVMYNEFKIFELRYFYMQVGWKDEIAVEGLE